MARDAAALRDRIKRAAQQAADVYAADLRHYYVENDNERDTVLLRSADAQAEQARAGYDRAIEKSTTERSLRSSM